MPKKHSSDVNTSNSPLNRQPARKKKCKKSSLESYNGDNKEGLVLKDLLGKKWKLGKLTGLGGFGEIYLVSDVLKSDVSTVTPYVAKVEKHMNGPLFTEINCYFRIGRSDMVEQWKRDHNLNFLGMPQYITSGSFYLSAEKYRYLVIPRYCKDLEIVLRQKKRFNLKTVLVIAINIINVLEYIHSKGYIHCDIKASNILLGEYKSRTNHRISLPKPTYNLRHGVSTGRVTKKRNWTRFGRKLRNLSRVNYYELSVAFINDPVESEEYLLRAAHQQSLFRKQELCETSASTDEIYLLDYGLATKYLLSNSEHRAFGRDERRAHAGTLLFCSRDAHHGVPSRRSDLESLGYNMVYWLTGRLPWMDALTKPDLIEKKKKKYLTNVPKFMDMCFGKDVPKFLADFFIYLVTLDYEETPNYDHCRNIFSNAINSYGFTNDLKLDFDNLEVCKKFDYRQRVDSDITLNDTTNTTLPDNVIFKRPKLRKEMKDRTYSIMNWSRILIADPEAVIRQNKASKDRGSSDEEDPFVRINLESLNPTQAMRDVYQNWLEREQHINGRTKKDFAANGYYMEGDTLEMTRIRKIMLKRKQKETEEENANKNNTFKKPLTRNVKRHRRVAA